MRIRELKVARGLMTQEEADREATQEVQQRAVALGLTAPLQGTVPAQALGEVQAALEVLGRHGLLPALQSPPTASKESSPDRSPSPTRRSRSRAEYPKPWLADKVQQSQKAPRGKQQPGIVEPRPPRAGSENKLPDVSRAPSTITGVGGPAGGLQRAPSYTAGTQVSSASPLLHALDTRVGGITNGDVDLEAGEPVVAALSSTRSSLLSTLFPTVVILPTFTRVPTTSKTRPRDPLPASPSEIPRSTGPATVPSTTTTAAHPAKSSQATKPAPVVCQEVTTPQSQAAPAPEQDPSLTGDVKLTGALPPHATNPPASRTSNLVSIVQVPILPMVTEQQAVAARSSAQASTPTVAALPAINSTVAPAQTIPDTFGDVQLTGELPLHATNPPASRTSNLASLVQAPILPMIAEQQAVSQKRNSVSSVAKVTPVVSPVQTMPTASEAELEVTIPSGDNIPKVLSHDGGALDTTPNAHPAFSAALSGDIKLSDPLPRHATTPSKDASVVAQLFVPRLPVVPTSMTQTVRTVLSAATESEPVASPTKSLEVTTPVQPVTAPLSSTLAEQLPLAAQPALNPMVPKPHLISTVLESIPEMSFSPASDSESMAPSVLPTPTTLPFGTKVLEGTGDVLLAESKLPKHATNPVAATGALAKAVPNVPILPLEAPRAHDLLLSPAQYPRIFDGPHPETPSSIDVPAAKDADADSILSLVGSPTSPFPDLTATPPMSESTALPAEDTSLAVSGSPSAFHIPNDLTGDVKLSGLASYANVGDVSTNVSAVTKLQVKILALVEESGPRFQTTPVRSTERQVTPSTRPSSIIPPAPSIVESNASRPLNSTSNVVAKVTTSVPSTGSSSGPAEGDVALAGAASRPNCADPGTDASLLATVTCIVLPLVEDHTKVASTRSVQFTGETIHTLPPTESMSESGSASSASFGEVDSEEVYSLREAASEELPSARIRARAFISRASEQFEELMARNRKIDSKASHQV